MAENKMTVQEAVKLMEGNTSDLSNEQLAQANQAFSDSFFAQESRDQNTQNAADIALALAEDRIQSLAGQDTYDAADLDNIISLAGSVSAFSSNSDAAKAILEKAQKQKTELEATAKADEKENRESEDNSEFEVGESDAAGDELEAEENHEAESAIAPENTEKTPDASAVEPETVEDANDEKLKEAENIPEDEVALEAFDKEYGIDTMTEEQLNINTEVMDAMTVNPFELNEDGKLVHPEFQEEYNAFQNLEITDDKGEPLSEEEQKKAKENLLETAVFEAEMLTRGTAKGTEEQVKDQYIANLKSSMQKAVVSTAFASEIEGKPLNRETYGTAFVKAVSQEGGIKTSLKNIVAYAGVVNGEMTKLKDRLKNKFKEIPAVQKMEAKVAAFDKRMSEKHPKMWKTAKRVGGILAKRAKGIAVYTAVGAVAGPLGLAGLAVKSGYDSYKGLKAKAEKEGMSLGQYAKTHKMEVGLAFTTSALSLAGSALGLGAGGSEMAQTVSPYLKNATRALAIGPKAAKAAFHGLKAAAIKMGWKKGDVKEELAAAKAALGQTFDATVGMVAGSYLNDAVHAGVDYFSDKDGDGIIDGKDVDHGQGWAKANEAQLDGLMKDAEAVNAILGEGHNHTPEELREMLSKGEFTDEQLKEIHKLAENGFDKEGNVIDKDKDGIADYKDNSVANEKQLASFMKDTEAVNAALGTHYTAEELNKMEFTDEQTKALYAQAERYFDKDGNALDNDKDGVADYKDVDHGEGWATANETQLNRLMDADPRGVNAILGDDKWHSSAELHEMMEKGQFTDEQLKAIHKLAEAEFDRDGHIIDKDLNKLYEDLAKQAKANEEVQQESEEEKGTPENIEKTPAEQKMYDSILATISKGEDMNNPEVRASVEALAEGYFNNVKGALAAGNEQQAVNILQGIHKQGEAVEVQEATQREEDDSRGVRHAKEDLVKVSAKLEDAKAKLAADPDNEKLQKEVAKLEKEFDKKSLNLDNKEIKQENSELKDQIKRDNENIERQGAQRENIEKQLGISQEEVNKRLAAAGLDINNLPKDTTNLPEDVQGLVSAHNIYAQLDENEAVLRGRVAESEQRREELKDQERENKEAMKEAKKGRGFSQDDEKRASIEDRLPGQSDFRDSELASSLVGMARGGNEAAPQQQTPSNEEAVDRFLRDQVAKGAMTAEEAQAQREALVQMAEQKQGQEGAEGKGQEAKQEYEIQMDQSPLTGKPKEAPTYQPENDGEAKGQEETQSSAAPEEKREDEQGYDTSSLDSLKADYLEDIEKNHGLNNVENIYVSGHSYNLNGSGTVSLTMLNSAENGYAMTSQEGAESVMIDENGAHFRSGSGDNLRDMTYEEAKAFTKTIMENDTQKDPVRSMVKYTFMLEGLSKLDPEAYARDIEQPGTIKDYADIIERLQGAERQEETHTVAIEEKNISETKAEEKETSETKTEEKSESKESSEATMEPIVAETKAGFIVYNINEQGNYIYNMPQSVSNDSETYDALKAEILKTTPGNIPDSEKDVYVSSQVRVAYTADAINKDIDARLARGENVPNADKIKEFNNNTLKGVGLEYDKDGKLHSINSNAGNVTTRGRDGGR